LSGEGSRLKNKGTGLRAQGAGKEKDMILDAGFWMLD